MEGLEKIVDAIFAEGKAAADKILENGRKKAAQMYQLYEREAEAEKNGILQKAEKEIRETRQRSLSQAGIESRNIRLAAKRQAVEQAFSLAQQELIAMPQEQKQAFYEKLISKFSTGKEVTVQMNEADCREIGWKLWPEGIHAVPDQNSGSFAGGLILKEGLQETNCTFEVLIGEAQKNRESEIASLLFS